MSTDLFDVAASAQPPAMLPVAFTVPGEPVALGRARVAVISGHARMYTPKESAQHKGAVAAWARLANVCLAPDDQALGVDVVAVWEWPASWPKRRIVAAVVALDNDRAMFGVPKSSRPDVDNVAKLVLDALNGIAFSDDGHVAQLRAAKVYGPKAATHIRIYDASSPPAWPARWW